MGAARLAAPLLLCAGLTASCAVGAQPRPNILWITSEDNAPDIGAFGNRYAVTPNLDALASRGLRYVNVWSTAPVCAPARTALITGMYPESTGGEHMRSLVRLPEGIRMFPALLRQAGYFTTNSTKQDYNVMEAGDAPGDGVTPPPWRADTPAGSLSREVQTSGVWDESSATAHWRHRKSGQPFFAVFNIMETHESFVQRKPAPKVHDPAQVRLPAYLPDTPEARADWTAYHDNMTVMDRIVGERLAELEADGVADDTIVFYYGDNGPALPRGKRAVYDSGLRVPLIVSVPKKFQHLVPADYAPGAASDRLVGFVDLGPTVLSLIGVQPPAHMQGRALMGRYATPAPAYAFGSRARMDERYDLLRSVRDQRYVYIRNYMPHRPAGQYTWYAALMPSWQAWRRLYDGGTLRPPQTAFWEAKPVDELYDLQADPDEVRNLAGTPAMAAVRTRLRGALETHAHDVRDLGFLPEYMLHRVPAAYTYGHDQTRYDFDAIRAAANQATDAAVPWAVVRGALTSTDPTVRYWAAVGAAVRGQTAVAAAEPQLTRMLGDDAPGARCAAGEALARYGSAAARGRAIATLVTLADVSRNEEYVALLALNALAQVSDLPADVRATVGALPTTPPRSDQRANNLPYVIEQIAKGLH